jgi:hypothetical protein
MLETSGNRPFDGVNPAVDDLDVHFLDAVRVTCPGHAHFDMT